MITDIINIVKAELLSKTYIQRFGGLVVPIKKQVQNELGFLETITFPISQSVNGKKCWEIGKYGDVVPNNSYKSIFYFEELNGLQPGKSSNRKELVFSGVIRLVGWMNYPKLGFNDCSKTGLIKLDLMNTVAKKYYPASGALTNARLEVEVVNQPPKDTNLFSKYSYDNKIFQLMLFPYDFFALDFRVELTINKNCISEFLPSSPVVECLDMTNL